MSKSDEQLHARLEQCIALHRLNRLDEATASYQALVAEAPYLVQAHYNLGLALKAQHRHAAAADSFRRAAALEPTWAEAFVNLSNALLQTRQYAEAERCAREALRLKPDLPEALFALGCVLREAGAFDAAIDRLSEAVRRHPNVFSIRHNLGLALKQTGRLAEAETAYRAAMAMQPEHPTLRYNLGELHLVAGRLTEGWEEFEYRWLLEGKPRRPFATPLWDGRPIPSGTLLLYAEQGLGDTIEFCRYVPLAAQRARTVLLAPAETRRLLTTLHPAVPVITPADPVPEHAFQCPLLSLPRIFGTTLDTIPGATPYLYADPAAAARWRERLGPLPGLRVGLVWAGNPDFLYDHLRSIPLAQFARLLATPGVQFISLQLGPAAAQQRDLPAAARLHDWTADLHDLADTAALIAGLDLVIGVDSMVIHLTGALGKPVWLLNRSDTDWRWLLTREDSPWYPTLRQVRQSHPGDWQSVLARVAAALASWINAA